MDKLQKVNKDKALSDDSKDLIDKAKKHILYSLQDIIVPTGTRPEASEEISLPLEVIGFSEPKPTEDKVTSLLSKFKDIQPNPTDFRSTLEMLFGDINRNKFDFLVPEVFERPNTKDTRNNIFKVRNSVDNMFNDKDLFRKILNEKHLVESTFNQKDLVENTIKDKDLFEKMFNAKESVEKMFNVQYDKLLPHSAKPKEAESCCCQKDKISTKLSYRLKKSSAFPPESAGEDLSQESPCSCECPGRKHGGSLRKIIQELGDKKLKISVRL